MNPHDSPHSESQVLNNEGRPAYQTLISVLPFLWPKNHLEMRVRVSLSIGCLLLGRAANVYGPIVLKDIIDILTQLAPNIKTTSATAIQISTSQDVFAQAAASGLMMLLGLYAIVLLLPSGLNEIRQTIFVPVSEYAQRVFALDTFRHLHNLSMRFHLDRKTGGLTRAIDRGTRALQQLTGLFAFNLAPTLLEVGGVTLYLGVFYDFKYVMVILTSVVIFILFTLIYTEWRTKYRREMVQEESRATTIGVDSLLNFETVKYFGNESFEAERYDNALVQYMRAAVKSQNTLGILNGGQLLTRVLCQFIIFILAVLDYMHGELSLGEVVMLNTFMLQLFIPLGFLGSSYRMIRQALIDMEVMFQILDFDPEIKDRQDAVPLKVTGGEVSFKNISFSYEPERKIIQGLSFCIPGGTTTAVVGSSGAGKSTLSRLLYRFYDLSSGSIEIDGQNIFNVTQTSLRSAVGIVPQDTVLFNDTIGYNIRYGKPEASEQEMIAAAKLASIHNFILSLPKGYQTTVGERGLKLSGGEKQRVALARTVLKNPPILVLDEATSALDINTEREIQTALKKVSAGRTMLIIAHRLATIIHADEILVLSAGNIIERGTHAQLVALGGSYAEMWHRQKEEMTKANTKAEL
ncbi:MAG: ABC transporter ATP-binding protein/permease [Pseudomonadales bacterium]|nr:ABC transporter ATP-binding protein/permease [Pseudomonadales bacterium]